MLKLSKNELATNVASKEPHRRNIGDVCLTRDGLVSTDGHVLLVIPIDGAPADLGDAKIGIKASDLKTVAKGLRKGEELELDTPATLANGHVRLTSTTGTVFSLPRSDETFVDYAAVWPTKAATGTVSFDGRLMAQLCKALAGDLPLAHGISLTIRGEHDPIVLECPRNGRKALLMPMRL